MKIEVVRHRYEKITEVVEVKLLEKEVYLWHNGIRCAYRVTPIWTDWKVEVDDKPEEIYRYSILKVDPEAKTISLGEIIVSDLPNIMQNEKNPYHRLVHDMVEYSDNLYSARTKEQFEEDFNYVLNLFQSESN